MALKAPLAALLVLLIPAAISGTGVLIDHVPARADQATVIAVIKQAFVRHRWVVRASNASSVTARYDGTSRDAEMTVTILNGQLIYEGSATVRPAGGTGAPPHPSGAPIPARWIRELRNDVAAGLATLPE